MSCRPAPASLIPWLSHLSHRADARPGTKHARQCVGGCVARVDNVAWDGKYSTYGLVRAVCKVCCTPIQTALVRTDEDVTQRWAEVTHAHPRKRGACARAGPFTHLGSDSLCLHHVKACNGLKSSRSIRQENGLHLVHPIVRQSSFQGVLKNLSQKLKRVSSQLVSHSSSMHGAPGFQRKPKAIMATS